MNKDNVLKASSAVLGIKCISAKGPIGRCVKLTLAAVTKLHFIHAHNRTYTVDSYFSIMCPHNTQ